MNQQGTNVVHRRAVDPPILYGRRTVEHGAFAKWPTVAEGPLKFLVSLLLSVRLCKIINQQILLQHQAKYIGMGHLSARLPRCMLISRPTISLTKYAGHAEPSPPAGLPYLKFNAV